MGTLPIGGVPGMGARSFRAIRIRPEYHFRGAGDLLDARGNFHLSLGCEPHDRYFMRASAAPATSLVGLAAQS
jgi:hypothetical protein